MSGNAEEISIRSAGPEDADLVCDFVYRLICELNSAKVDANLADYEKAFLELISSENNKIFIATDKEKAVGIITVVQSIAVYVPGSFGVINELYVLPEYRSCGVGRQLVSEVIEFGKQKRWGRIEVGAPNRAAWQRTVDFYLREGFVEIGPRLKKYFEL